MADISKIKLPDGNTYSIKDAYAYRKGQELRHRNTSIDQDPQYISLFTNKMTGEYQQTIRAIAGVGDYFYALHLNPEYTVTSNYSGKNGTKGQFDISTLFAPNSSSTVRLDVNAIAETPFVLTINKKNGMITATDVVNIELFGHTLGDSGGRLTDYKIELYTTGSTANTGEMSWQTVYERHNVSDTINGLVIALNSTNYSYLYFSGVRFTISGATSAATSTSAWNYNCIVFSMFRLTDQRPAFSAARAIGALDIAGGSVYGPTTFTSNVTINGSVSASGASLRNLNGSNIATGTVAEARIAALSAGKITSGTFDAARIPVLDASKISSGTLSADRIPVLGASKITSGTFAVERIPDLNASKITDGTLSADLLPTSGVTAGSYGPSENQSPAHGETFSVPSITTDAKGRVTSASTKTVTLPTYATATSSANGLMSATDKSKLDSMTTVPLASGLNMTEGTDGLIFTYVS